jgi:hypothetical protein
MVSNHKNEGEVKGSQHAERGEQMHRQRNSIIMSAEISIRQDCIVHNRHYATSPCVV